MLCYLTHLEELFSGESSELCQVAILCCMVHFLGYCEEEGGCGGGWPFSSVEGTNVFHCWCQLCKSCIDLGEEIHAKTVKKMMIRGTLHPPLSLPLPLLPSPSSSVYSVSSYLSIYHWYTSITFVLSSSAVSMAFWKWRWHSVRCLASSSDSWAREA